MLLHNGSSFVIYFGDKKDRCVKATRNYSFTSFKNIKKVLPNAEKLVFIKQEHGVEGVCIDDHSQIPTEITLFKQKGDFIITSLRKVGIGILSADCLPLVIYDLTKHIIAVAHVGWKGAVGDIVLNLINTLKNKYGSKPSDFNIYFGPCAKVCCYQVENIFLKHLENFSFIDNVIFKRDEKIFFNLPRFIKFQLINFGVKEENIHKEYNNCTICDTRFYSYRRGDIENRQASVVLLK
ncbi:peptidoglycan editing factor PgeF [Candidatus Babeliales bacterium]|nr:peptidoglycan editing factor PgeF [Candidatus Babeliales bacterium]